MPVVIKTWRIWFFVNLFIWFRQKMVWHISNLISESVRIRPTPQMKWRIDSTHIHVMGWCKLLWKGIKPTFLFTGASCCSPFDGGIMNSVVMGCRCVFKPTGEQNNLVCLTKILSEPGGRIYTQWAAVLFDTCGCKYFSTETDPCGRIDDDCLSV